MAKVQSQDLIDEFFKHEVRRSIKVNTFNKLRKKQDNKGVAIAAPKKEKK